MAVIITYPTVETPAPRFEGAEIAQELKRLFGEDHCPELCFMTVDKLCYPRRRLIAGRCYRDGTIHLVVRIAGSCHCPHNEERFYFTPGDRELMPMEGKRITALVVGYPQWEVSTVIENTHLGTKFAFDSNGRRMAG